MESGSRLAQTLFTVALFNATAFYPARWWGGLNLLKQYLNHKWISTQLILFLYRDRDVQVRESPAPLVTCSCFPLWQWLEYSAFAACRACRWYYPSPPPHSTQLTIVITYHPPPHPTLRGVLFNLEAFEVICFDNSIFILLCEWHRNKGSCLSVQRSLKGSFS